MAQIIEFPFDSIDPPYYAPEYEDEAEVIDLTERMGA